MDEFFKLFFQSLKHKNIVEIIGAIHEPDISLVMEYVQHGSLQTYLKINKETLKPDTLLKFASDVASVRIPHPNSVN